MNDNREYRVGEKLYASDVVIAERPKKKVDGKYVPDMDRRMPTWKLAKYLGLERKLAETVKKKDSDGVRSRKNRAFDDRVWAGWCAHWHPLDPVSNVTKNNVRLILQSWNDK